VGGANNRFRRAIATIGETDQRRCVRVYFQAASRSTTARLTLSKRAEDFRRTMRAETLDEAALKGAAIFPETHALPPQFERFKTKGVQTIVVCYGKPRLSMTSLFCWLDACITLAEVQDDDRRGW
jgi:hypothetical protein